MMDFLLHALSALSLELIYSHLRGAFLAMECMCRCTRV